MNDTGMSGRFSKNMNSDRIGFSVLPLSIYLVYAISGYSGKMHNYILFGLFVIWNMSALMESTIRYRRAVQSKAIVLLLLFLVYFFLTSMFHGVLFDTLVSIASYLMQFGAIVIYKFYSQKSGNKEIKTIIGVTTILWLLTSVYAIVFYELNPSAARTLAGDYYAYGNVLIGGGYSISFGSALVIVYLFERLINNTIKTKKIKFIVTVSIIILTTLVIKVESSLTFIAVLIGCVLCILRRMWKGKEGRQQNESAILKLSFIIIIFILFVLLLINIQGIGSWIVEITNGGVENVIVRRFNRIGQKLMYFGSNIAYENYIDTRWEFVQRSWKTFIANPLFGVGYKYGNIFSLMKVNGVGSHSELTDMLAQFGFIGALPLLLVFYYGMQNGLDKRYDTYVLVVLFMMIVNPFKYFHTHIALFTIIPMIKILFKINAKGIETNNFNN